MQTPVVGGEHHRGSTSRRDPSNGQGQRPGPPVVIEGDRLDRLVSGEDGEHPPQHGRDEPWHVTTDHHDTLDLRADRRQPGRETGQRTTERKLVGDDTDRWLDRTMDPWRTHDDDIDRRIDCTDGAQHVLQEGPPVQSGDQLVGAEAGRTPTGEDHCPDSFVHRPPIRCRLFIV